MSIALDRHLAGERLGNKLRAPQATVSFIALLAGASSDKRAESHIRHVQPAYALLRVHVDSSLRMRNEFWRDPRDQVGVMLDTPSILHHRHPSIPRRRVIDVKEPIRLDLGSTVGQFLVWEIHEKAPLTDRMSSWARGHVTARGGRHKHCREVVSLEDARPGLITPETTLGVSDIDPNLAPFQSLVKALPEGID